MGDNAQAARSWIDELVEGGRLVDVAPATVMAVKTLAAQVDDAPDDAALWREYRAFVVMLQEASVDVGDDGGAVEFAASVRAPVGDSSKRPRHVRGADRRGR